MKFNLIKNVIGAVAPTLGSALGGPLGGQAASVVAQVLGCAPEPKAISQAIQTASPEQMLELKKAEKQFEVQLKELEVLKGYFMSWAALFQQLNLLGQRK